MVAAILLDSLNKDKVFSMCDASYVLREAFYRTEACMNHLYEVIKPTYLKYSVFNSFSVNSRQAFSLNDLLISYFSLYVHFLIQLDRYKGGICIVCSISLTGHFLMRGTSPDLFCKYSNDILIIFLLLCLVG